MKIAIQGHPTRGKEVIQILESLGGDNMYMMTGLRFDYYYINSYYKIDGNSLEFIKKLGYTIYTLEEFEEEFPFKVGDEVFHKGHKAIVEMFVPRENCYYIRYNNPPIDGIYYTKWTTATELKMKEERNITLTLDKAKEWYKKGGELKEVALQAYSEEELTKVDLPKTWEEFCKKYPIQDHEAFINYTNSNITVCKECAGSSLGIWMRKPEKDRCKCVSQKSAEAHLALIQLEQLRDCWRQGWKPTKRDTGYSIIHYPNEYLIMAFNFIDFLSFPTKEMAEEFLKCFRDLIEKAGDLI